MEENILILKEKFEEIKRKGWIKIPRCGYGEAGLFFEKQMGLNNNDFSVADFNGIEIKVKNRNSKYPITLFSNTCDGPDFYEIKRIVQKYGMRDLNYKNAKVLFITLSCNKFSNWGRYLKMKLHIDEKRQRLYILITHANGKIIEKRAFWDFSTLKETLNRKLEFLCYVTSDSIFSHGMHFIKYSDCCFSKLKSFDKFIYLLKKGEIVVNIKCGIYKHGPKAGKPYDHGTAFQINKMSLFELYDLL